jgi:lysophospholipase L1-like esterase
VANIDELSVGPPTPVTATPVPSTPTRTPAPPTATPAPPTATPAPATQLNFDFGPGPVEPGYTQVLASTGYSAARGYGFLDPSKVAERDRGTPDNLRRDFCLPGDTAFRVDLPNADYQVTYISGDALAATAMSVRAEGITKTLNLAVAAGSFSQQTFNISLIDGHLDLEFVGAGPRINALQIKRLPARAAGARPTVYIAGDSTVQTYSASYAPQAGWGQFIANYFTTDVAFVNKAIGGRSSKSFVLEGRLDEILGQIRPNDYLFVQMGHNDATKSRPERYTDPQTTYKQYLKMYLDGARQRGATPVLITPVGRLNYKNGVFVNDFTAYTTAMKELAAAENVKLIDLMSKSLAYYTSIGYNETYTLFMVSVNGTDYTHFTEKGANQIARLVSEGVREINVPISRFKK